MRRQSKVSVIVIRNPSLCVAHAHYAGRACQAVRHRVALRWARHAAAIGSPRSRVRLGILPRGLCRRARHPATGRKQGEARKGIGQIPEISFMRSPGNGLARTLVAAPL